LVITVVFPEGRVQIDQFKKLREEKQPQKRCPYDSGSSHNSHETLRRQTAVESYPAKKGSIGHPAVFVRVPGVTPSWEESFDMGVGSPRKSRVNKILSCWGVNETADLGSVCPSNVSCCIICSKMLARSAAGQPLTAHEGLWTSVGRLLECCV